MKAHLTYLGHSGFLLEWPECAWLFDWWTGELPPLDKTKPLLVFVSHRHHDHFNPAIFALDHPDVQYLLGSDLRPSQPKTNAAVPPEKTGGTAACQTGAKEV